MQDAVCTRASVFFGGRGYDSLIRFSSLNKSKGPLPESQPVLAKLKVPSRGNFCPATLALWLASDCAVGYLLLLHSMEVRPCAYLKTRQLTKHS